MTSNPTAGTRRPQGSKGLSLIRSCRGSGLTTQTQAAAIFSLFSPQNPALSVCLSIRCHHRCDRFIQMERQGSSGWGSRFSPGCCAGGAPPPPGWSRVAQGGWTLGGVAPTPDRAPAPRGGQRENPSSPGVGGSRAFPVRGSGDMSPVFPQPGCPGAPSRHPQPFPPPPGATTKGRLGPGRGGGGTAVGRGSSRGVRGAAGSLPVGRGLRHRLCAGRFRNAAKPGIKERGGGGVGVSWERSCSRRGPPSARPP